MVKLGTHRLSSELVSLIADASSNISSQSRPGGLVLIFTGDGKGKTSAALGTVVRALGEGLRVYFTFFMKSAKPTGERAMLARLQGVTMASFGGKGFVNPANIKPEDKEQARQALTAARDAMLSGKYDIIILDEVNVAVGWELVPLEDVINLIDLRPDNVDIILTGRRAHPALIDKADVVTEMRKIKHPFDKGTSARRGIDF